MQLLVKSKMQKTRKQPQKGEGNISVSISNAPLEKSDGAFFFVFQVRRLSQIVYFEE